MIDLINGSIKPDPNDPQLYARVRPGKMSYEEFQAKWNSLTEAQKDRVRAKAEWEHITLWAVLNRYPGIEAKA